MQIAIVRRIAAPFFITTSLMAIFLCAHIPNAAAEGPPLGTVKIMNKHSGLCLSPAGAGVDKNVEIVQFTCDEDPSRSWTIAAAGNDLYKIVNAKSGMCLTLAGGVKDRNIVAVQYFCDQDPSRIWRYSELGRGARFRFVNVNSGLCLTIAGGVKDKNAKAVQFPCDGDPSRDWMILPKSKSGGRFD